MTAHINVLVDSRTFKYCFNITRPGNNLDTITIDHFTMYTVYCTKYFMSIISKQYCTIGENYCNSNGFCNSYSNNWESKRFKNSYSIKLIK